MPELPPHHPDFYGDHLDNEQAGAALVHAYLAAMQTNDNVRNMHGECVGNTSGGILDLEVGKAEADLVDLIAADAAADDIAEARGRRNAWWHLVDVLATNFDPLTMTDDQVILAVQFTAMHAMQHPIDHQLEDWLPSSTDDLDALLSRRYREGRRAAYRRFPEVFGLTGALSLRMDKAKTR